LFKKPVGVAVAINIRVLVVGGWSAPEFFYITPLSERATSAFEAAVVIQS